MNHKLSYFLAHLNLASKQKRLEVVVSNTKLIQGSLSILLNLGYINSFVVVDSKQIRIFLKYNEYGEPAIRRIILVSSPGSRVYVSYQDLSRSWSRINNLNNTYQNIVLSTSNGLLLHHYAIKQKIGGEVLFLVN